MRKHYSRLIVACLAIVVVAGLCVVGGNIVKAEAATKWLLSSIGDCSIDHDGDGSTEPKNVVQYNNARRQSTFGIQFSVSGSFTGIHYKSFDNGPISYKLYKWQGTYEKTAVDEYVVTSSDSANASGSIWDWSIDFGTSIPAGEYLFVLKASSAGTSVRTMDLNAEGSSQMQCYLDGSAFPCDVPFGVNFVDGNSTFKDISFAKWLITAAGDITLDHDGDGAMELKNIVQYNNAYRNGGFGVQFNASNSFNGLRYGCFDSEAFDYTLYRWKGDYTATLAAQDIVEAKQNYQTSSTNAFNRVVSLDKTVSAGEYLFVFTAPSSNSGAIRHLNVSTGNSAQLQCYVAGKACSYDIMFGLDFVEMNNSFGNLSSSKWIISTIGKVPIDFDGDGDIDDENEGVDNVQYNNTYRQSDFGIRFKADGSFEEIRYMSFSSNSFDYTLYRWKGDYVTTMVICDVVESKTGYVLPTYSKPANQIIKLNSTVSAGEYLLVFSAPDGDKDIRNFAVSTEHDSTMMQCYLDGVACTYSVPFGVVFADVSSNFGMLSEDVAGVKDNIQAAVSLTDSINVHITATVANALAEERLKATLTFKGVEYDMDLFESDGEAGYTNLNAVFTNILPQEICETFTVRFYAGDVLIVEKADYSVQKYCFNLLGNEKYKNDESLHRVVVSLLNYGAEAQRYFDNVEDPAKLATNGLTVDQLAALPTNSMKDADDKTNQTGSNSEGYAWKSATLSLKNTMVARIKFQANDTTNLKIVVDGIDYIFDLSSGNFSAASEANTYYFYYWDIMANQFDDAFEVTMFVDDSAVSKTLTYSVNSYVHFIGNKENSTVTDITRAIYYYGIAAAGYNP